MVTVWGGFGPDHTVPSTPRPLTGTYSYLLTYLHRCTKYALNQSAFMHRLFEHDIAAGDISAKAYKANKVHNKTARRLLQRSLLDDDSECSLATFTGLNIVWWYGSMKGH